MKNALLAGLLVMAAAALSAEEFGSIVTVSGESPTPAPFLKCRSQQREILDEEHPASCKDRESRVTFGAKAVRVTNLGDTLVWIHVGEDKVPLLPRSVLTVGAPGRAYHRLFFSPNEGETARVHVFATDEVLLDRVSAYPDPEKPRR